MISPYMLHYLSSGFIIAAGCLGAGIGQGIAGLYAVDSINRQPLGESPVTRALIAGLALIESGIIIALVASFLILFSSPDIITWPIALTNAGMGVAIGLVAAATSIASGFAVKAATQSISRHPLFSNKILTLMLLSQSLLEAPVIFTFVLSLIIRMNASIDINVFSSLKYCSCFLVLTLGSLGPAIGQALFSHAACKAVGLNKYAYNKIFTFSLFSQAFIETPLIFCLVCSLLVIFSVSVGIINPITDVVRIFMGCLTLGLGSLGTSIGIGYASSKSCRQISSDPENYSAVLRTTLVVIAFIESSVIYAMVVALILLRV